MCIHRDNYLKNLRAALAFLREMGISQEKICNHANIARNTLINAKKGQTVLAADRYLAIIRYAKGIKKDFEDSLKLRL
jgi:transcriptional regulator with XRE-family HTH domain